MSTVIDLNSLSNLNLCELKNLLYLNNKNNNLDKKTISLINEIINYKIKKSHIEKQKSQNDPIQQITKLLIENDSKKYSDDDDLNSDLNLDLNLDSNSSEYDDNKEDTDYYGHNKFKNSKKVRNEKCTQTSQKLLNRMLGEANFRYSNISADKVIKPYSQQGNIDTNNNLGRRKNIF
jgi:hypothetical protein